MKNLFDYSIESLLSSDGVDEEAEFIPIITDDEDDEILKLNVPDVLPILPLRNTVLFPGVVIPISIGREKSLKLIKEVYRKNKILGAVAQNNVTVDEPEMKDLYKIGTVAQILKILEMPDGSTSVIIQGKKRFEIMDLVSDKPY